MNMKRTLVLAALIVVLSTVTVAQKSTGLEPGKPPAIGKKYHRAFAHRRRSAPVSISPYPTNSAPAHRLTNLERQTALLEVRSSQRIQNLAMKKQKAPAATHSQPKSLPIELARKTTKASGRPGIHDAKSPSRPR
jgi:hypothetical protein